MNTYDEKLNSLNIEKAEQELENLKAEERRRQEEHDANMQRKAKSHEAEMNGMAALMAVLGAVSTLAPSIEALAKVHITKKEFGDDNAIRAAACGMLKEAAGDDPEAKKQAARELLALIGKANGKVKAA